MTIEYIFYQINMEPAIVIAIITQYRACYCITCMGKKVKEKIIEKKLISVGNIVSRAKG